jgi:hypothetical protein
MNDQIYTWIKYGLNFFEILACVIGFLHWKKIRKTYWKLFPVYLFLIVCVELTGKLLNKGFNVILYSYFGIPLTFLFFFWLFSKYFENRKERKWPLIGMAIYCLAWLGEMFFFNEADPSFISFTYTFGNVILAVFVLLFFLRFISSDDILGYRSNMMFWVCCGLLIFYLGSLPLYGLWNTLSNDYKTVFNVYWIVHMVLNYTMYIFFSIAFIWGKPK